MYHLLLDGVTNVTQQFVKCTKVTHSHAEVLLFSNAIFNTSQKKSCKKDMLGGQPWEDAKSIIKSKFIKSKVI